MQHQPNTDTTERKIANLQETLRSLERDAHAAGLGYHFLLMAAKRQFIIAALERQNGRLEKAAFDLKIHRNTLSRAMAELKLNLGSLGFTERKKRSTSRPLRKPALAMGLQQHLEHRE